VKVDAAVRHLYVIAQPQYGDKTMNGVHGRTIVGVLALCLFGSIGLAAAAEDAASPPEAKAADNAPAAKELPPPAAKPAKELSPALAALRDRVRRTLEAHRQQALNTRDNSPTEIMAFCLAFGCGTEVLLEGQNGKRINGITSLCWNYPCSGFEMLCRSQGRIAPRTGYGYQEHPGEFLAMLALSRVQSDYPARIGKDVRTVADLAEAEKLGCRSGSDLSLKLVGLSYYVEQPEWKNDLGDAWSLERIIEEELAQPVVSAPEGGLNRLLGLSYAVVHRAKHKRPMTGQFQRAEKYAADFHNFALRLQNSDGSWGPSFLATRSNSQDAAVQLRSTGRVLEWLAVSLPDQGLEDARVQSAVDYVLRLLGSQRYQWNAQALPTREIVSWGHALHALTVYDERVFKPADVAEKPAAADVPAATAASEARPSKAR
jgi:hypothetical protein